MSDGFTGRLLLDFNGSVLFSGGVIEDDLSADGESTADMIGGAVGTSLGAHEDSIVTMRGGSVGGLLKVSKNGTIYLDGTGFEVNGVPLENGDKLSDFATLVTEDLTGGLVFCLVFTQVVSQVHWRIILRWITHLEFLIPVIWKVLLTS